MRPHFAVDFDGTVSLTDTTDHLLDRFAGPEWQEVEQDWVAGRIGSRECLARQIAMICASECEIEDAVLAIAIDPAFPAFAALAAEHGATLEIISDGFDRFIMPILNSGFYAAKFQIPAMRNRGGGSIVFTSSFVGHTVGLPGMGAYAAAKTGLIGLTQVLAAEHGPENIRVNALLPGGTMTPMAGDDAGFHEVVRGFHALKRMAEPSEIAKAAMFLLSDHASFVTGSAMIADGGNSINKL